MTVRIVFALLALSVGAACGNPGARGGTGEGEGASGSKRSSSSAVSAEATAEARNVFRSRCSPCHGAEGKGDGPTSKGLNPPPRNFQDRAWQTKTTDAAIEAIIERGGNAVGKSPLMPPNPDLADKPEVIKALRAQIRALAGH